MSNVSVVETASFITGPYAGQLLADLGADVIKIEHPHSGDPFRGWGEGQYSPHFIAYNRNKRSITLDLKRPDARDIFKRMVAGSDVLIENFRPGVAERLGIGYSVMSALNESLIYCSISGLGPSGPYADRPSYDTIGQGLSGMLSLLLDPLDPRPIGPAFSDSITGLFACYAILAALHARNASGKGQHVQTSMLQATIAFLSEPFARYFRDGYIADASYRPRIAQVYAYKCADGLALAIHLSSPPKFWDGLLRAMGQEQLRDDERFRDREARVENYEALRRVLEPIFLTKPRAEWLKKLSQMDVPCTPIYTVDQVLQDPQVKHLEVERSVHHPTEGSVKTLGYPVSFSGMDLPDHVAPPTLGEHSKSILTELGYSAAEIAEFTRHGALG